MIDLVRSSNTNKMVCDQSKPRLGNTFAPGICSPHVFVFAGTNTKLIKKNTSNRRLPDAKKKAKDTARRIPVWSPTTVLTPLLPA